MRFQRSQGGTIHAEDAKVKAAWGNKQLGEQLGPQNLRLHVKICHCNMGNEMGAHALE